MSRTLELHLKKIIYKENGKVEKDLGILYICCFKEINIFLSAQIRKCEVICLENQIVMKCTNKQVFLFLVFYLFFLFYFTSLSFSLVFLFLFPSLYSFFLSSYCSYLFIFYIISVFLKWIEKKSTKENIKKKQRN